MGLFERHRQHVGLSEVRLCTGASEERNVDVVCIVQQSSSIEILVVAALLGATPGIN